MRRCALAALFVTGCEPVASGLVVPQSPTTTPLTARDLAPQSARPIPDVLPDAVRSGAPIGSDGPISQINVAADGGWHLFCQAQQDTDGDGALDVQFGHHGDPRGDQLLRYLTISGGPGVVVDETLAITDDDERMVIRRGDRLELIDLSANTLEELVIPGATRHQERRPSFGSFASKGSLVYGREGTLVVRDGSNGRAFDLGNAVVGAAQAVGDRWVRLLGVWSDTDGNGSLEWPSVQGSISKHPCAGPYLSYSVTGGEGDTPETRWLDVEQGALISDPAMLWPLDAGWLTRASDGAIVVGAHVVADAACEPVPLVVRDRPWRVTFVCGRDRARDSTPLRIAGEGMSTVSGFEIRSFEPGEVSLGYANEPLRCGAGWEVTYGCADLEAGRTFELDENVVYRHAESVLVYRGGMLETLEIRTGKRTRVAPAPSGDALLAAGSKVAVAGLVVDVETSRVVGKLPAEAAVALDETGRLLVAAGTTAEGTQRGPFRWVDPAP